MDSTRGSLVGPDSTSINKGSYLQRIKNTVQQKASASFLRVRPLNKKTSESQVEQKMQNSASVLKNNEPPPSTPKVLSRRLTRENPGASSHPANQQQAKIFKESIESNVAIPKNVTPNVKESKAPPSTPPPVNAHRAFISELGNAKGTTQEFKLLFGKTNEILNASKSPEEKNVYLNLTLNWIKSNGSAFKEKMENYSSLSDAEKSDLQEAYKNLADICLNTQGEFKDISKTINAYTKSLNIDVSKLTDEALESHAAMLPKSEGNALKDFVKYGTAFTIERGYKVEAKQVNEKAVDATFIGAGMASIYSYKIEDSFKDMSEMAKDAVNNFKTGDESQKKESLGQINRLLDTLTAMSRSKNYNQSINKEVKESKNLNEIIEAIKSDPELMAIEEVKTRLISLQKELVFTQSSNLMAVNILPDEKGIGGFNDQLNSIRNGKSKNWEEQAKNFAMDSRDIFCSLLQKVDAHDYITRKGADGKDCQGSSFHEVSSYANKLSGFIVDDILDGKNEKQRANTMKFYIKVATSAAENGDFATAYTIHAALNNAAIGRLKKTSKALGKNAENESRQLETLFDTRSNNANYVQAVKKFESKGKAAIRIPGLISQEVFFVLEGNKNSVKGIGSKKSEEEFSNLIKMNLLNKVVEKQTKITEIRSEGANRFLGSTNILSYKPNSDDATYALSLKREPRASQKK